MLYRMNLRILEFFIRIKFNLMMKIHNFRIPLKDYLLLKFLDKEVQVMILKMTLLKIKILKTISEKLYSKSRTLLIVISMDLSKLSDFHLKEAFLKQSSVVITRIQLMIVTFQRTYLWNKSLALLLPLSKTN